MDLSSLNVDVLLYLMKFVKPDDRFNLVLSGVLKGFENANEGIDIRQRIEDFGIELGPCRDGKCQLEIRSLKERRSYELEYDNPLIALERLVDGGYFQNTRQLIVDSEWPSIPRYFRLICSMTNLEKIELMHRKQTLIEEDLARLFQSCPRLTELHLRLCDLPLETNEELRNELRSGYQRLKIFELEWDIVSCPTIQENLTWLKDCAQLTVRRSKRDWTPVIDGYFTPDPDLSQNLRDLRLDAFPVEFVKWILPFCSNIHTLKLHLIGEPKDVHNEIACLTKLNDLYIGASKGIDPKEVEILRVDSRGISLRDLADLERYENLKEVHLRWLDDRSVKKVLPIIKRCTNLRRLTLAKWMKHLFPSSKELCDFIMELKHLTFLHIIYRYNSRCDHFKSVRDKVNSLVLPRRLNFEFYLSCCSEFSEFRVPTEFLYY